MMMLSTAAQPKNLDSKFMKYKPSSGGTERTVRMVGMPVDPLDPPKFKHKRLPKANGSPPVPVMQSPPRPVTVEDQKEWRIPPCVSNWKNPKRYTIPLDKRVSAGLQEVQINDQFAHLSEALYVAEQQAREAVSMRSKVQKEMIMEEKGRKEQELRTLAQKARLERTGSDLCGNDTKQETEEWIQREKIRAERRRERERERRLDGKKRKMTCDRDRDISEKVALGMAWAGSARGGEVMYDQRLFNQEKGMGSTGDDRYNVYDTGLFTAQPTLSTLYRPNKDAADDEMTDRWFKKFTGVGVKSGPRDGPVQFETDPFGLDQFMTQVKGVKC